MTRNRSSVLPRTTGNANKELPRVLHHVGHQKTSSGGWKGLNLSACISSTKRSTTRILLLVACGVLVISTLLLISFHLNVNGGEVSHGVANKTMHVNGGEVSHGEANKQTSNLRKHRTQHVILVPYRNREYHLKHLATLGFLVSIM